jgi:Uma2 family endonuclease
VRVEESEVEPDLFVRPGASAAPDEWEEAPLPFLVVEILSDTTRRRDHGPKRALYTDVGIPEYWVVDGDARTIRLVRSGAEDLVASETLTWHPTGASAPLTLDVRAMFREALGA